MLFSFEPRCQDDQLPADLPAEDQIEGAKSRYTLIVNLARRGHLTVRQHIGWLGGGCGHRIYAGTPGQVADANQEWFDAGAADGFQHHAPVIPCGLDIFVHQMVTILQSGDSSGGSTRDKHSGGTSDWPNPPTRTVQ